MNIVHNFFRSSMSKLSPRFFFSFARMFATLQQYLDYKVFIFSEVQIHSEYFRKKTLTEFFLYLDLFCKLSA